MKVPVRNTTLVAATAQKNAAAAVAWQAIQKRLQPPLCTGHREPSVIRTVKKGGENQGACAPGRWSVSRNCVVCPVPLCTLNTFVM